MFKDYFNALFGLIFPSLCYACRIQEPLKNHNFCLSCLESLPFVDSAEDSFAALAGKDFFPDSVDNFWALFYYTKDSDVAEMIHRIKYDGQFRIARYLGKLLAEKYLTKVDLSDYVIIPVPVHPKRRRERGFNQAEEIAKGFISVVQIPIITDHLIRSKNESSQTAKDKDSRSSVLGDSFILNPKKSKAFKNILLIDDVITTGSTIGACVNQLSLKKPDQIIVASLGISI